MSCEYDFEYEYERKQEVDEFFRQRELEEENLNNPNDNVVYYYRVEFFDEVYFFTNPNHTIPYHSNFTKIILIPCLSNDRNYKLALQNSIKEQYKFKGLSNILNKKDYIESIRNRTNLTGKIYVS
jgi:hypothetical protein